MTDAEMKAELTPRANNPLDLVQLAIQRDLDVDKLEKLLDMQKSWQADEAKRAYFAAMNSAQEELPRVIRDRKNDHTRSMYATLEAVNTQLVPVFTKHGFSVSFNESECAIKDSIKMTAIVRHTGGHQEEFSTVIPLDGAGAKGTVNKTGTQAKGSTIAYSRRYLLLMIGNVTVCDEDTDGNPAEMTISEDAIATINGLIETCRSLGNEVNVGRFLKACGVADGGDIGDIKQDKFLSAVNMLNKKIAASAAGASA